ncbi:TorD/DmsD family molecular chaperone [Volucribacter amazonae]|uniref:TorA maturation chaperone TorD n=1 Tax=Volucribacter amazonae TaxID=256731 RepID=A0A9X4PAG4_9PAST|nr:molecular chaperone [Volucribacter amazonae]MDG6894587.1 hypothetical protein [Volucribacter amazonae]
MTTTQVTPFSLISRLFGNLFYRQPQDPILANIFAWLAQQQLSPIWPLSTDNQSEQALKVLQSSQDLVQLNKEYEHLFDPQAGAVKVKLSDYDAITLADFLQFRQQYAMPVLENADHIALLLLTSAWIEDNLEDMEVQKMFFVQFLLPCASQFLGQVEAHAHLPFYRALSQLCRDMLSAMADELEEQG